MARRQKKYHYIYKTTNTITGRYYIGMHSTDNLDDGYMGSGKRLWYSFKKYGKENHVKEILEFLPDRQSLRDREEEIVNLELLNEELCMNIQPGGGGGFINQKHEESFVKAGIENFNKTKEKREETLKLRRNDPIWVKNRSEKLSKALIEYYKKNDGTFKGRKHSPETKQKMSEASKGKGTGKSNSQYGTCWVTKDGLNKKIKKEDLPNWIDKGLIQQI
jgi:hypothetical protein